MFPVAVLIVPIYTIMSNLGLINTRTSLVVAYCTIAVPFCAWMLRGYFNTIPREIDEAASLDGLGPFATFWRVMLPLARPGLAVTAFYSFLTAWGEVAYASAFIQTDDKFTLAYGLQTFVSEYNQNWALLTPAAILITIPSGAGLPVRPEAPGQRTQRRRDQGLTTPLADRRNPRAASIRTPDGAITPIANRRSRMMRRLAIVAAVVLAVALVPQIGSASSKDRTVLEFDVMVPVTEPFTGATNPIRDVPGGGLPWELRSAEGELQSDGDIEVEVRGLVLARRAPVPPEIQGTNPVPMFKAIVSCVSSTNGVATTVNVSTDLFPANTRGNAEIEDEVDLPSPCIAPIVFVTSPTGAWFAATGA